MDKFAARNQKFETNLKLKAPMFKTRLAARFSSVLNFWSFEFVSGFELRISDLLFQDFPVSLLP